MKTRKKATSNDTPKCVQIPIQSQPEETTENNAKQSYTAPSSASNSAPIRAHSSAPQEAPNRASRNAPLNSQVNTSHNNAIPKIKLQEILSHLRRADEDFGLIKNGDRIAVGLSGGKDSLLLLQALAAYQKFHHTNFELIAITIDCTNGTADFSKIKSFCENLGIKYIIKQSNIFEIIFDIRKEKNPCSLCSKLRRGMLHSAAAEHGCNKVALGHHADDLIETFFLSLLYEGRLSTFSPTSYLDRTNLTLIRPLLYASERSIEAFTQTLPILKNTCPVNHHTQREYMKNLVKKLDSEIPDARRRMLDAITNQDRYNLFPQKKS